MPRRSLLHAGIDDASSVISAGGEHTCAVVVLSATVAEGVEAKQEVKVRPPARRPAPASGNAR
jgi:hypothetical protein